MTSDTVWHGLKNIFYGLNNWKKKSDFLSVFLMEEVEGLRQILKYD